MLLRKCLAISYIHKNGGSVWAPAWKLLCFYLAILVLFFKKARSYSNLMHHINKHSCTLIENVLELSVILYKYLGIFYIKISTTLWNKVQCYQSRVSVTEVNILSFWGTQNIPLWRETSVTLPSPTEGSPKK